MTFDSLTSYYSALYPEFSTPHYSNLGFVLLGRAVERAVGQHLAAANSSTNVPGAPQSSYEQLLMTLLQAANLTSTGFEFAPSIISRMAGGASQS